MGRGNGQENPLAVLMIYLLFLPQGIVHHKLVSFGETGCAYHQFRPMRGLSDCARSSPSTQNLHPAREHSDQRLTLAAAPSSWTLSTNRSPARRGGARRSAFTCSRSGRRSWFRPWSSPRSCCGALRIRPPHDSGKRRSPQRKDS